MLVPAENTYIHHILLGIVLVCILAVTVVEVRYFVLRLSDEKRYDRYVRGWTCLPLFFVLLKNILKICLIEH